MKKRNLYLLTGDFLKKESDRILHAMLKAKTDKTIQKRRIELQTIKNRIAYEIKLIEKEMGSDEESD